MEEERKLKMTARIQQLVEEGQMIELELRGKEATSRTGNVVFVGDDYIEFVREVKGETTQEDGDETTITIFNLTTITLLDDVQAFTILKEGATVKKDG